MLFRVLRRHVMRLHHGERLLPPSAGRSLAGVLERRSEVDSGLLFLFPVTTRAVGVHEWANHLFEGLPGISLQLGEIGIVRGLRRATQAQRESQSNDGQRHRAPAKYFASLHSFFGFDGRLYPKEWPNALLN